MAASPARATRARKTAEPKVAVEITGDTSTFGRLSAKFPAELVKQREGGGGKKLDYISIDTVINRINDVMELEWSFEGQSTHLSPTDVTVRGETKAGWLAVVTGHLTLHTPEGDRKTFGVGSHRDVDPDMAIKSALAESEKKAAQRRGIGLYLWDEEAREELAEQRREIARASEEKTLESMTLDELKLEAYEQAVAGGLEEHTLEGTAAFYKVGVEVFEDADALRELLGQ